MKRVLLLLVTALAVAVPSMASDHPTPAAAAGEAEKAPRVESFAEFVTPADSLPRLRFLADGKISLNDRCPVRKVRLNPRMGASYVNGRPVGFC